jgi:hypothetical protein
MEGIMHSRDFGNQAGGMDTAGQPDAYGPPPYANAPKYHEAGRGFAIAGIVLGFVLIIATVVLIVAFMTLLVHGLSNNTATF